MSLTSHVAISIAADSVGVTKPGFGVPLIASANASFAERVRSYSDLAGLVADSFATDSPEYLAAQALLAQNPKVPLFKIGRCALKPTQKYTIIPTAANATVYSITVEGEGVTTETVTYTSDSDGTVAEIVAGLTTALNAVVGKNYTAVDTTSTSIVVTATAAGDWFSLAVADPALLHCVQDHADPGIATDLAAIVAYDDAWYSLITLYNSKLMCAAAAADIEARSKIYVVDSSDGETVTTAVGNGDLIDALKTSAYARVAGIYHPSPADFAAAAWQGDLMPREPGSATWKFKRLAGVSAYTLTTTQRANLVARNGNGTETAGGVTITFNGTMSDGTFLDDKRGLDWLQAEIQTEVFAALASNAKIPFTDDGVSIIKGKVTGALLRGVRKGVLAASPEFTVTAPLVADVSAANKAARTLPDVKFTATLAGAIHNVTITGVVSV